MQGVDPLTPGALLAGRYRIGPLLGAGGMSFVHRAVDETLGREVAVKALIRTSAEPVELERIGSEIDLLATLSHRALVTLYDAGTAVLEARTVTYLVMELVDGPTLGMRVPAGPIAAIDLAHMAQDMAEALVVVHSHGVVHRDIKPANILLAPSLVPGHEFTAKLADFGIAAIIDGDRLTDTGTVLGTAAYLSPEQAAGGRVGSSSDIYSLGLVLLEAITGHREYPGPLMESLSARQSRDPQVPGEIGYHWKSLLTAMTARDPDARPTARAVLERLATAPDELPVVPARSQPAAAAAAGAAALGAGATGAAVTGAGATGAALTGAAATGAASFGAAAAATAASPAAPVTGAPLLADDDASDTKELAVPTGRRRRRGWLVAASAVAALAVVAAVALFAMQGIVLPQPGTTSAPEISQAPADLVSETSAPPTPTPTSTTDTSTPLVTEVDPAPEPTETAPAETTPAETEPAETAPAETAPVEPAPTEPAPVEPVEPAPTEAPAAPSSTPAPPEETSSS